LTGCTSPRQMTLFSSKSATATAPRAKLFVIEPNDRLSLVFTAINAEAVALFNSAGTSYLVRDDGTIDIPILGRVQIAGKNTEEATKYLEDLVRGQVKDPIVQITITNASVTILGEVAHPTRINISEPIALPHVIGMVGGFTTNARLKDIQVLRSENGTLKQYHINLLTDELFSSPCYYLQKGDVVDVLPLHAQ